MNNFSLQDVHNIEDGAESEEDYYLSIQRGINSLVAWKFQGSYGRSFIDAIKEGRCLLGLKPTHDYWGNRIPSRFEVQEGTKGSRQFVVDNAGEEWADLLESIDAVTNPTLN